jgi:hypothetical protein
MGFWRSCVRKALEDKVWNEEIREGWSRTNYERWDRWRMTDWYRNVHQMEDHIFAMPGIEVESSRALKSGQPMTNLEFSNTGTKGEVRPVWARCRTLWVLETLCYQAWNAD